MTSMKVLIVTGGIGSGKSSVGEICERRYGAVRLDADRIVHQLLEPGTDVYETVVGHFGGTVVAGDGTIKRGALARVVFDDEGELRYLEGLTHPKVRDIVRARLREAAQAGGELAVVEIPLLGKSGLEGDADAIVFVAASEATRLRRLVDKGASEDEARRRMAAGPDLAALKDRADYVIDNDGDLGLLEPQVARVVGSMGLS